MIIDAHAHIILKPYFERLETLPGITVEHSRSGGMSMLRRDGTTFLPFRDAWFEPDHLIRDMDRKGIDLRILSLSTPNLYPFERSAQIELARWTNDEMLALCRRHPDRLRGCLSLPFRDIDASLAELDRMAAEPEIVGVLVGSNIDGVPLSDPVLEPVWARINALRLAVFEHPMHPVFADAMREYELPIRIGFMMDTSLAIARMIYAGVFERHPDFPFIAAHTGGGVLSLLERLDNGYRHYPDCRARISKLPSEYARLFYYDTCAFFAPAIMMAHGFVGADRLLFGTDYPFIDYDTKHVEDLPIPAEDKARILGGNISALLNIDG